ncbi:MAG: Fic family protein [Saprospirales bacterium]|nr:Fic family protein [Saprospirales bacterium]
MAFNRAEPYNELPPLPPAINLETGAILKKALTASRTLAELKGLYETLPDPRLLINTVALQESRDSSAIENIVTTQDELYRALLEEQAALSGAKEVIRYREAAYAGWEYMRQQQGLLTLNGIIRVMQRIKETQAGIRQQPGTVLKNAVTGSVVFTPPCCEDVILQKLGNLERFINEPEQSDLDPLIKMALIHYQFETIHPFADGNGRTGRILNVLYLVQQGLLPLPALYLSAYIVQYKQDYYRLLREVTEKNNWEEWVLFMLTAVEETAMLTIQKIRAILQLKASLSPLVIAEIGSLNGSAVLDLLFTLPYVKIDTLVNQEIAHRQTASTYLRKLVDAEVLYTEKRGRVTYFVNYRLMEILAGS